MRRQVLARRLGICLGVLFVGLGVAETVRALVTGDGGLAFWFGTLVGGGTLILLSTVRLQARPGLSLGALIIGALAASVATAWTVVLPLLALLLIVLRLTTTPDPERSPERGDARRTRGRWR
ncbi:hypothetical protein [Kribbella sp. HUAS MG21]|uniref:Uncharacterized protein n=1 Tax=Kribbella sp. HUAS MG21 TaxID=3160966 RepID=A0AAU7T7Y4_9ACTN